MTTEKKNYYGHFLTALKAFKTERELHHCLTTLKVFNSEKDAITVLKFLIPKKDFITCLGLLKFLTLRKSSITSLRLLKVLILKNDSITFLWLLKFFKIAGEQPLLKAAYHIIFMINKLHLLSVPNFIALGINFLFGTTFSWNWGIDTCVDVELLLPGRNFDFLGGYLVVTICYLVVTACCWWSLLVTASYCSFRLLVWTQ